MSKDWYAVDVKDKVFEEFKCKFSKHALNEMEFEKLKEYSTRELMDGECLERIFSKAVVGECREFVKERFFYYRSQKYGNEDFWNASSRERDIAYHNRWHEYIKTIISNYCPKKGNILFVGTANGNEIPFDDRYNFYALEQLDNSANHIDRMKCQKVICGDFENEKLLVEKSNYMDIICALRCMTPNTRIEKFFKFADLNLKRKGFIIMSHPMGYLNKDGKFMLLPDAQVKLSAFRNRLSEILNTKINYVLEKEKVNIVESFFYLKRIE